MREIEVSMALIWQVDRCHLQRRLPRKELGAAGLVGCFGGQKRAKETPRETLARELKEETTLRYNPDSFHKVGEVSVVSDRDLQPVLVNANVFSVLLPEGTEIEAKEGQLVTWTLEQVVENQSELTPATEACFKEILGVI